jgi:hypothetical protein
MTDRYGREDLPLVYGLSVMIEWEEASLLKYEGQLTAQARRGRNRKSSVADRV